MDRIRTAFGPYPTATDLTRSFRRILGEAGAVERELGRSVEGRPLLSYEMGPPHAPVVLLTALIHGVEWIGALALRSLLSAVVSDAALFERARWVVLPVVNPDALDANSARLEAGRAAWKRCNASGVDLNRNFAWLSPKKLWHPLSGSTSPLSPYHLGPGPFSEPETRAIRALCESAPPSLSLAFHSFGELLIYPYAFKSERHPRADEYERLGRAMNQAMPARPYQVKSAASWYPVQGDLDDYLDHAFGSLAMTVEVSSLDRRLLHPARLANPFCWMNPTEVEATTGALTPGLVSLLEAALPTLATQQRGRPVER